MKDHNIEVVKVLLGTGGEVNSKKNYRQQELSKISFEMKTKKYIVVRY